MCYGTTQGLYNAIASDCSPLTSNGYPVQCTPTDSGYDLKTYQNSTDFSVQSVSPVLIDCAFDLETPLELFSLVVLALLTAFLIKNNTRLLP